MQEWMVQRKTGVVPRIRIDASVGTPMEEVDGPAGDRFVDLPDTRDGEFIIEMRYHDAGRFSVDVVEDEWDLDTSTLFEAEGPWSGRAICDRYMSAYRFQVSGDGSWQMRMLRYDERWEGPSAVQGIGDAVFTFEEPATPPFVVEADHVGDILLWLDLVATDGGVLTALADVERDNRRRIIYFGDRDVSAVRVHAQGAWRANVNELFRPWPAQWALHGTSDASILLTRSGEDTESTGARFVHEGAGRVTLTAAGPYGQQDLVDAEGGFDGIIDLAPDTRVLAIWADGDWSIDPLQR